MQDYRGTFGHFEGVAATYRISDVGKMFQGLHMLAPGRYKYLEDSTDVSVGAFTTSNIIILTG